VISDLRITTATGEPARCEAGGWVLDEARRWRLTAPGGPFEVRLDARRLEWDQRMGGVCFDLPFAVGHLRLELRQGGRRWEVPLRVRPAPSKLRSADWEALLTDLEAWLPGLVAGAEGPRVGSVGTQGVAAPLLAEALLPLLPQLERALLVVLQSPRRRMKDRLHPLPLHRTRAADRETVAWLAQRPREAAWLDPVRSRELSGPPPEVYQRITEDTLDHPANRHIAWLVQRLVQRLTETADALERHSGSSLNDSTAWTTARAAALRTAAARLNRRRRGSFLRQIRPQPASQTAMRVVLDHPAYARVHRLARRVLAARFRLEESPESAATRPSFELYELWCLLAVQRELAVTLGADFRWRSRGLQALLTLDGTGGGAGFVAVAGSRRLELLFNPTFTSALRPTPAHGRTSLSTERRPDLVITWTAPGCRRWLVLDAKYRAGAANLGDALASAHLYRDALRWEAFGGRCLGAYLLAPRASDDAALWFEPAFHDANGLGVLALTPGTAVSELTRRRIAGVIAG